MTIKANGFAYEPKKEFPRWIVDIAVGNQVTRQLNVQASSVADAMRVGGAAVLQGERAVSARIDR